MRRRAQSLPPAETLDPADREAINRQLHDIRRALQLIALCPDPPPELAELADAVAGIDAIVNNRGRQARRARGQVTELSLLIAEVAERFRLAGLARPGQIRLELPPAGIDASIEPAKARRALANLVANALEHGGGRVTVSAGTDRGRPMVTVATSRGRGHAIVGDIAESAGGSFGFSRQKDGTALARLHLAGSGKSPDSA